MRASLATLLAVGALGSVNCVETDGSVFIEGVMPVTRDDECTVSATGNVFQPGGTLDLSAATGYRAALKVRTNLPSTFSSIDVSSARTQSPNYPAYGNIDNNVLIIESATVNFEFATDPVTMQALIDTAALEELNFQGKLECDKAAGSCTYGERTSVASGSIFNPQTSLNTPQAIFIDALPSDLASELGRLYVLAANEEGVSAKDNPVADLTGEPNLLQVPAFRQVVTAKISLNGTTSGGATITSVPFPYPIELCLGCLSPDQTFCDQYEADLFLVAEDDLVGCFVGIDAPTSACLCTNEDGEPTGRVDRDRTICTAPSEP